MDFQYLMKIEFCWGQHFEILIMDLPSLGSWEVLYKIWARSVQLFRNLLVKTNKQIDKQSIYIDFLRILIMINMMMHMIIPMKSGLSFFHYIRQIQENKMLILESFMKCHPLCVTLYLYSWNEKIFINLTCTVVKVCCWI